MGETMKLQDLVNEVTSKKLMLPDFQRKFVWDTNDMKSLFASVICKMPFGSILTLESNDDEFSCKRMGAKPRSCEEKPNKRDSIEYLIDGQQRLTSLFAGFTTYYFTNFKTDYKSISGQRLLDLYFLKIPTISNKNSTDLFSVRTLSFTGSWNTEGNSYISSEDVKDLLHSESVSSISQKGKYKIFDISNEDCLNDIFNFCTNTQDDFYYIPLQLILCNEGKAASTFRKILKTIGDAYSDKVANGEELIDNWVDNVKTYLMSCMSELQLNRIKVKNSDKVRAIDIYSNLNKGGVALNLFDLVMAKVGSVSKENFYDTLVGHIQKNYTYSKILKENHILQNQIDENYVATSLAEVLSKDETIATEYINNFLNILSLYIAKKNNREISPDLIKQTEILKLPPQEIFNCAEKICEAMDRALFFFQTRCGIRKLSDINYKAEFTLVAYFFTEDKYFNDIRVHNFFEYWYWISLFAYMYPSNQNVQILNEISRFSKYFETSFEDKDIFNYLVSYQNSVLEVPKYSDKATLTMQNAKETEIAPEKKMSDYVCQFYLAKGYSDFFEKTKLNSFYENKLDMHHIMPLGSSPDLKIGESTKKLRNSKYEKYNSPLNMLYITQSANKKISAMEYVKYSKDECISNVVSTLGCVTGFDCTIDDFLTYRYKGLKSEVLNRLKELKEGL